MAASDAALVATTEQSLNAAAARVRELELELSTAERTAEAQRTLSRLTNLTKLGLSIGDEVSDNVISSLRSLAALTRLDLTACPNVSAEAKQSLRTALSNLTVLVWVLAL